MTNKLGMCTHEQIDPEGDGWKCRDCGAKVLRFGERGVELAEPSLRRPEREGRQG